MYVWFIRTYEQVLDISIFLTGYSRFGAFFLAKRKQENEHGFGTCPQTPWGSLSMFISMNLLSTQNTCTRSQGRKRGFRDKEANLKGLIFTFAAKEIHLEELTRGFPPKAQTKAISVSAPWVVDIPPFKARHHSWVHFLSLLWTVSLCRFTGW